MTINYIVHIQDWYGAREAECETVRQVWDAIGTMAFGGLRYVTSPTGLSVDAFIPY